MSVLDNENLNNFLSTGAFISMNDGTWILAWNKTQDFASHNNSSALFYLSEFIDKSGTWQGFSSSQRLSTSELRYIFEENISSVETKVSPQGMAESTAQSTEKKDKGKNQDKQKNKNKREWLEPRFEEFSQYFHKFQADDRLEKIVPVVFSESDRDLNLIEKKQILKSLLEVPADVYAYGYWDESQKFGFIGATPEILFSREETQISTMALAGTARKGSDSLLDDPKEKKEHFYVIEDIKEKLSNCQLKWQLTHEWEVGNLKHLRTNSTGYCELPSEDIINRLHPTSALGGMPGRLANTRIAEYCDVSKRKFFGAPFGVKTEKQELIVVALRNVQWFNGKSYLGSGCGLVKESSLEKEWKELEIKRAFTRNFLNI